MTMATAATATDASVAIRKRSAIEFSQTKAKQKCVREKVRYHHKAEICCLCLQWDLIYFEAAEDLLWWFRTGRAKRREKEWQKNRESKKTAVEKAPMFVIWEFFDDVCYYQATKLTFDHSHCTLSTFFRWCVFLLFDKNHLFFRFYRLFTLSFIYIKLENMAYAFATNQNSTFKIQAELNWFRFVCVIWCVAKQNDGFEW